MVTIKINHTKYDFEMKKSAAEFIVKTYNETKCPICNRTIHLSIGKVYRKLQYNIQSYENEVLCSHCDDRRKHHKEITYYWLEDCKKVSKTFSNSEDAKNYISKRLFCQNCGKHLTSRFNHLGRYFISETEVDFSPCLCHECSAAEHFRHLRDDEAMRVKLAKISADNGRKGANKTSESIMSNDDERKRRSETMKQLNEVQWTEERRQQASEQLKTYIKKHKRKHKQIARENGKNIHTQNKRAMSQALSRYQNLDTIYLYFAEVYSDDTVLKIGITKDIENRSSYFNSDYKSITCLLETDPVTAANLEYLIKEKFQIQDYDLGTEFFSKENLKKVKNFVNNHRHDFGN